MKHLVVAVSLDSSLELLASYADIVILDKDPAIKANKLYDTLYIRSHFSQPSMSPQAFRNEIEKLVESTMRTNQNVKFIDNMSTVDEIVAFEDKWLQYETFGTFMPRTELYTETVVSSSFLRPVYKMRLSSRGTGVTWDAGKVPNSSAEWIIQESLDIQEELRVYVIRQKPYPVAAVKHSMSDSRTAQSFDTRLLTPDEAEYALNVMRRAPELDMVGIDMARTANGELKVLEVNRSPGFAKFHELTGFNLAQELYEPVN